MERLNFPVKERFTEYSINQWILPLADFDITSSLLLIRYQYCSLKGHTVCREIYLVSFSTSPIGNNRVSSISCRTSRLI